LLLFTNSLSIEFAIFNLYAPFAVTEKKALTAQLTSEHRRLIAPDEQLQRIGFASVIIPKRRGRLFFFDEANLSWCPQTGRVYRVKGEPVKIDSSGINQTKYILGSLESPTGFGLYEIYPRKRNEEVKKHLSHLLEMFSDDYLFVVRDNTSSHTTPKLDSFLLQNQERLCFVPLPTYSPNLNLIERLWHYMRDNLTRSHFYKTFVDLCESLVEWLQTLPFSRFQSLMGVGNQP
jgi:hypothetical protein